MTVVNLFIFRNQLVETKLDESLECVAGGNVLLFD